MFPFETTSDKKKDIPGKCGEAIGDQFIRNCFPLISGSERRVCTMLQFPVGTHTLDYPTPRLGGWGVMHVVYIYIYTQTVYIIWSRPASGIPSASSRWGPGQATPYIQPIDYRQSIAAYYTLAFY